MHFDLALSSSTIGPIWGSIQQHGFLAGLVTGPLLLMLIGKILPALTRAVISLTGCVIPPIVAWVKLGMVWLLAFPVARAVIVANKEAVKRLLDAVADAVEAVTEAVEAAIDEAIDQAATKPGGTDAPPNLPGAGAPAQAPAAPAPPKT